MEKKNIRNPHFASSEGARVDESYMLWIEEIKSRYKKTQIKAAVKVNAEQLFSTGSWDVISSSARLKSVGEQVSWSR